MWVNIFFSRVFMVTVQIEGFNSWRLEARRLLAMCAAPEDVHWQSGSQEVLFSDAIATLEEVPIKRFNVPEEYILLAKSVSSYRDDQKWSVLYRVLWRIVMLKENVLAAHADTDIRALHKMRKAVNRDMHKMKAFVRFRKIESDELKNDYYTAWFEPEHLIVEAIAPFFKKRFTGMHWSILTPDQCVHWDQQSLTFTDGVARPQITRDDMDDFWRVYYCSIFNPARLKEKAMQSEMPKKYWKYLPEAREINPLRTRSAERVDHMLEKEMTPEDRLRTRSKKLREAQDALRDKNST